MFSGVNIVGAVVDSKIEGMSDRQFLISLRGLRCPVSLLGHYKSLAYANDPSKEPEIGNPGFLQACY